MHARSLSNRICHLHSLPTRSHNIRGVSSNLHSCSYIPTTSSSFNVHSTHDTRIGNFNLLPTEVRFSRGMIRKQETTAKRFVYNSASQTDIQRAFPQYSIFGEKTCLTIKPSMPKFKRAGGNGIVVQHKGKLNFEFTPYQGNKWQWDDKTTFALTPEEAGLLLSQLPHYPVTLVRSSESMNKMGDTGGAVITSGGNDDEVKKVFTVTPAKGVITFEADYVQNGSSGNVHGFPMKIDVQLGEWEVVKSLLEESIPYLLGWRRMLDIATNESLSKIDD